MPLSFDIRTGNATTAAISFGAMGDSYYEYLLKVGQLWQAGSLQLVNASMHAPVAAACSKFKRSYFCCCLCCC